MNGDGMITNLNELRKLTARGRELLDLNEPAGAQQGYAGWVKEVAGWLGKIAPGSPLHADWLSKWPAGITLGDYYAEPGTWFTFQEAVKQRLLWLSKLPARLAIADLSPKGSQAPARTKKGRIEEPPPRDYVERGIIDQLKSADSDRWGADRLVCFCEELNACFAGGQLFAVISLTRTILGYVAPLFRCKAFAEVATLEFASSELEEAVKCLDNSFRNVSNHYLGSPISQGGVIPSPRQVDFADELNILLAEVVRLLK